MQSNPVAPLAGAWIETATSADGRATVAVAPLAGAWIETSPSSRYPTGLAGRAPRGRVD